MDLRQLRRVLSVQELRDLASARFFRIAGLRVRPANGDQLREVLALIVFGRVRYGPCFGQGPPKVKTRLNSRVGPRVKIKLPNK